MAKPKYIWEFFERKQSTAVCNTCQKAISLGHCLPKQQTTSNIKNHLKKCHPHQWELFIQYHDEDPEAAKRRKLAEKNSPDVSKAQSTLPKIADFLKIIKDEYDQADDDVPDNIYESSSSPNAPIFNSISLNPPTQRSKRKTVVNSHDEDPLQTQRNQRAEEDEFDIVGKNFAYKLRGLPKTARTVAEKLMSDILFQAELGNVGVNTTITINNTD